MTISKSETVSDAETENLCQVLQTLHRRNVSVYKVLRPAALYNFR
jgi:hypothetical protein